MKRIFIAIPFEASFKDYLSDLQDEVEKLSEGGKYHRKENFHLTLEFIGMVPEKLISPLWGEVLKAIEETASFELTIDHFGRFDKKNKCIPWVGVESSEALMTLQKKVMHAVSKVIDHTTKHDYKPHITLGRQVILKELPSLEVKQSIVVTTVALMESSSKTGTLLYTPLYSHQLK